MRTAFANGHTGNYGHRLLPCAQTNIFAVALFGCLIAGAFMAAPNTAGAARSVRAETLSVNRTSKGDRLTLAPKPKSTTSSSFITTMRRPPVGCDPVFSRTADPARAHIFGRCIS